MDVEAVIASQAHDKSKNKLDTGSLGFSNIENKAEFDVNSASVAGGTSIAGGKVTPTAGTPAFYSHDGDASSTTQSAVAEGEIIIRHQDEQQQDITQLSRDTDNANNALDKIFDKEKEQNRQDIVNSLKELAAQVKKLEQDFNQNAGKESTDGKMGNAFSKGIDAATSILTGLITGDIAGGLAGASAQYLAELIKNNAPDEASRFVAHALLGATIAQLQGNSVLSGGSGALLGETAADIIRRGLYNGRNIEELSESEKDNISALAQLASGFAIALAGGNTNDIGTAVAGSKNAVENNSLAKPIIKGLEKGYASCMKNATCRNGLAQLGVNFGLTSAQIQEAMDAGNSRDPDRIKELLPEQIAWIDKQIIAKKGLAPIMFGSETWGDRLYDESSDNGNNSNHPLAGGGAIAANPGYPPNGDNNNDDDDKKDQEKDNSKADNKNSNSSNNSVKDNQTVDKLNQKQESAVKKIDNLVKNSIKDHDIEGALKDMGGNPVPKADGSGYWNHLKELQDTLNGLRNHANTLKDVNNPTAQAARQKALEAIERIESAIKGYGL
ncbi:hypothetical protein GCM10023211_09330 [Orbus sasakiae]|uniref:VENN motif-containing domain-containing protein n=1 Tax=Orbus sasakiae TaxID=1078475 RepID=A0ABP9N2H1_9GAMM